MIKKIWEKYFPKINFPYRLKNIKNFPKFIKEVIFFLKHGYTYDAIYSNFAWFIDTEKDILCNLLKNHCGYPCEFIKYNTEIELNVGNDKWEEILETLIYHLNFMDEDSKMYGYINDLQDKEFISAIDNRNKSIMRHKDEFFELFSKVFFNLWN